MALAATREGALIAAAQKGDLDAFNQLVLDYQQLAYNLAYRILGNQDHAMDATQDAFLRGYRALYQFRGGSFKVWLLRIISNCCYDQLRAMQRRPTTSIDDLLENDEHSRIFEDPAESPEQHAERRELGALIQSGLDTLPADQREVVMLSDVEGMDYEEIAQVTAVSLGTVKSRLSRARAKLRQFFASRGELLPSRYRLSDEA
jgi:RNA polymerase sigma-70 factor (ECF subfamily)